MKKISNKQLKENFLKFYNGRYGYMSSNYRVMNSSNLSNDEIYNDMSIYAKDYSLRIIEPDVASEFNNNKIYSKAFNCYELFDYSKNFIGKLMVASSPNKLLGQSFIKETLTVILSHLYLSFDISYLPFKLSVTVSTIEFKYVINKLINDIINNEIYLYKFINKANIIKLLKVLNVIVNKTEFSSTDNFLTTFNNSISQSKGIIHICSVRNALPYINKNVFTKIKQYGANLSGYTKIDKFSTMDLIIINKDYDISLIKNFNFKNTNEFNKLFTININNLDVPFVGISLKENLARLGKWRSMFDFLKQPCNKKYILDEETFNLGIPKNDYNQFNNEQLKEYDRQIVKDIQTLCKKYHKNINYIYKQLDNIDWNSKGQKFGSRITINDMRYHFIKSIESHMVIRWLLSFDTYVFIMGTKWSMSINNNNPDILKLIGDRFGLYYNLEENTSDIEFKKSKKEFLIIDLEWKQTKNLEFYLIKDGIETICKHEIFNESKGLNVKVEAKKFDNKFTIY